jgi:hypothetical protein
MPTPYTTDTEPLLRNQIENAQKSLGESFALTVKRLREKADEIERMTMRATEAGLNGDLGSAHVNIADQILNEIAWLTPNLPVSAINSNVQRLVRYQAILQQMGVLVTEDEREAAAILATQQALVEKVKRMIHSGVRVKVGGRKVVDLFVGNGYGAERTIMYRWDGRKYARAATSADIEELKAADNPSYVSRRSIA